MTTNNDSRLVFFFGAGAEVDMGFPTGAQYTEETMLRKNEELYDALQHFYEGRTSDEYSGKYRKDFLFKINSHTFREIIERALQNLGKSCENMDSSTKALMALYDACLRYRNLNREDEKDATEKEKAEKVENDFKEAVKKAYLKIAEQKDKSQEKAIRPEKVSDQEEVTGLESDTEGKERSIEVEGKVAEEEYGTLRENLSYAGAVEKDFSSIISPKTLGPKTFWRLINYFWTAYFSIACPVLEIEHPTKQDYKDKLSDLVATINEMYSPERIEEFNKNGYYDTIHEEYPGSVAVTTNYTPFVEYVWREKSVYLAGKLSQMEDPTTFEILDLRHSEEDIQDRFLFPYILTQAPVKPIIGPEQIAEYSRLAGYLSPGNTLVMIGFSLGNADNHINAYIRAFVKKGGRLVYCAYQGNKKYDVCLQSENERKDVRKALRFGDSEMGDKIEIICFDRKEELLEKLRGDDKMKGSKSI